ncbi:MAG: hypothetical protein K0R41_895 [Geminicoccaceae bacterium]|jgi:uncharacterized membrane protein (UPF0127 family)|nr:hypothetical protein [Geminicoccaceae bacterium]MCE3247070.1 hypothetical protein [Geminicoccaceae bacterium]
MNALTSSPARRSLLQAGSVLALIIVLMIRVAAADAPAVLDRDWLTIEAEHGPFQFEVEVARTPAERARGLMFRESLADGQGMLFDFGDPQRVAMWMRNTLIPLDILFIRSDGRISSIAREAQPLSDQVMESAEPVRAVLELPGGLTAERGIEPGDRIVHPLFQNP